jgi:pimeloyl-ACP methyl ester carboxylesterase
MDPLSPIFVVPGAGGGTPDLALFRREADDTTRIEAIRYPGWSRYIADGYTTQVLIADLAAQITAKVPRGPIRIVGISIGGHFGYAIALHLQAGGHEIAGFCAIDTFMMSSAAPSPGWQGRALMRGSELLRKQRFGELSSFLRSLFWRAQLRLAGRHLPGLFRVIAPSGLPPRIFTLAPMLEGELSMRLLIRDAAPWVASLDREPVALSAPALLLRTRLTAGDDAAWCRRCPGIKIIEIPGNHETIFESENARSLHEAYIAATRSWR